MADLLIYGDTERSATMRHEVPIAVGDPFLFLRAGERTIILTSTLERDRIAAAVPGADVLLFEELGLDDLIADGLGGDEVDLELIARAVARAGIRTAAVPPELPVAVADRLRADGIELVVDGPGFAARRRAKTPPQLEGIRRAQRAAEAAMSAAAALLREAEIDGDALLVDDAPLTAERVRAVLRRTCAEAGAPAPEGIMVVSAWSGGGHEPGSGPLPAHLPIEIDLWPRDETSACFADMTRTFVVGEIRPEVADLRDTVREALEVARAAIAPGVTGAQLHAAACEVIEAAGHQTQRTLDPAAGKPEGFCFSLGHGVGLEVHEEPLLGRTGHEPLVPGDVVAIEPGIEETPVGGVRFEDLVLVTAEGSETLTDWPYDLTP